MSLERYVNESTSIIQLDGYNSIPIVYISSSKIAGHLATIRDQTGYISTPSRFVVSTTQGISISSGISTLIFDQAFSYLTLVSQTSTLWSIVNISPLHNAGIDTSCRDLDAIRMISPTVYTTGVTSTASLTTETMASDTILAGYMTTSSIFTNVPDGNTMSISGSAYISSATIVGSSLPVYGYITTNRVTVGGSVSSLESTYVQGPLTVNGSFTTPYSVSLHNNVYIESNYNIGGPLSVESTVNAATVSAPSIHTVKTSASTFQVRSSIQISSANISFTPNQFNFDTSIVSPNISTTNSLYDTITTQSVRLREFGSFASTSIFALGSAQINNSCGSLITSSIAANSLTISTVASGSFITGGVINPSSLAFSSAPATSVAPITFANGLVSTIPIQYYISSTAWAGQSFNASKKVISSINFSVDSLSVSTFGAPNLSIQELGASTFGITNSMIFTGSTVSISKASLVNTTGFISTQDICANSITITGSLALNTIQSTNPFALYSTTVRTRGGTVSSLSTNAYVLNTLNTSVLTVGSSPAPVNPLGPMIQQTDIQVQGINAASAIEAVPRLALNLYPYHYRTGYGHPQDPVTIYATTNYQQYWTLTDIDPTKRLYLTIDLRTNTSVYSSGHVFSANVNGVSTVFTFNPAVGADSIAQYNCDITDIPIIAPNPVTSDLTPYIEFKGYGNSDVVVNASVWLSYSTATSDFALRPTFFNSNEGIQFQNGALSFPNALYATTIVNSQNDTATRNLLYTGGLFSPSDSTLKENIELAPTGLATIDGLTLRNYSYTEPYCSTFQLKNSGRTGLITTEVAGHIPEAVQTRPFPFCGFSTVEMIDDAAIKYAHLAATKALIYEVSTLRAAINKA